MSKHNAKQYAKALHSALLQTNNTEDIQHVTNSFGEILKLNNDLRLWPYISRYLLHLMKKGHELQTVNITSAKPLREDQQKLIEDEFPEYAEFKYEVRADIIGGIKIIINDELKIDASLATIINSIF